MPKEAIIEACKYIAYEQAVGKTDLSGNDWESIFAKATGGESLSKPLGLADVIIKDYSYSVKTVKSNSPHTAKSVRIISGRNNVSYSYDIHNPLDNIELSGKAVLEIFNTRIETAKSVYKDLVHSVLVRSSDLTQFTYFEYEAKPIQSESIFWKKNTNNNLEGYTPDGEHIYTWQPNGSQFTIIYPIPEDAIRFSLKKPQPLDVQKVVEEIGYSSSWVEIK
ncbi:hypothetical protein [Idiomarina sp.]|uniref:hypothetical protein n=1 Tax=Idiomarina sp. TaxID=1874361 RepID=UPI002586FCE6|nr:hypothetical protein [Idiomarina sp.]